MIRRATPRDLAQIEDGYNEHFDYELEHEAFTVFKKGVYPTAEVAAKAISTGDLYVCEEDGRILASVIIDHAQSPKYADIPWSQPLAEQEVMVLHLLMVRPSMAGRGIASALVRYAEQLARERGCKALRLDTGSQNRPAVALYQKLGFDIVATSSMKVGSAIEHSGHLFLEKELAH